MNKRTDKRPPRKKAGAEKKAPGYSQRLSPPKRSTKKMPSRRGAGEGKLTSGSVGSVSFLRQSDEIDILGTYIPRTKASKTLKAFDRDIEFINEIAKKHQSTAADVVHELCHQYRQAMYQEQLRQSAKLMALNAQHMSEIKLWDSVAADGLSMLPEDY